MNETMNKNAKKAENGKFPRFSRKFAAMEKKERAIGPWLRTLLDVEQP